MISDSRYGPWHSYINRQIITRSESVGQGGIAISYLDLISMMANLVTRRQHGREREESLIPWDTCFAQHTTGPVTFVKQNG